MPSNKYATRWKQRGRNYRSERKRSYHKDRQALRGQVVAQWSIERRRMTRANMKNLFEIRGEMYEMSRFGQKFKRSSGTEIAKETAKSENIFKTCA